jgi:uncharacterized protein YlxP (DUF503 family)
MVALGADPVAWLKQRRSLVRKRLLRMGQGFSVALCYEIGECDAAGV